MEKLGARYPVTSQPVTSSSNCFEDRTSHSNSVRDSSVRRRGSLLMAGGAPAGRGRAPADRLQEIRTALSRSLWPRRLSRLLVWANALVPSLVDKIISRYFRDRIRAAKQHS